MKTLFLAMLVAFAAVLGLHVGQYLNNKAIIQNYTDKYFNNRFIKSLIADLQNNLIKYKAGIIVSVIAEVTVIILILLYNYVG